MDEKEYETILQYLKVQKYPENSSENEKRRIRAKKDLFVIKAHKGIDYMYTKNEGKAVVTDTKKESVMEMCHIHSGSHLGRDKTIQKVKERYFWRGMFKDISNFVKKCTQCQYTNKKTETTVPEMISVPIEPRIWSKIGIDLIGPIDKEKGVPLSENGYRYILTVMDYFSKWPEAFPIYSKSTEEIVDKLHGLICRFGVMNTVISDQGGEFNSKLIDRFQKKFGIKQITTSPYHPQANGMIEKFNSTLKSMLNKTIIENGDRWDEYVDTTLFSYRTSEHESTKVTPFYALYMRKAVLPNEEEIAPRPAVENEHNDIKEVTEKLKESRKNIEEKMMKNIKIAQKRQKKAYDIRHQVNKTSGYNIGDKVLLKNFRRKKGLCTQTRYTGPYVIFASCGKGNFKLQDCGNKEKIIGPFNQKSFKAFYEDEHEDEHEDEIKSMTGVHVNLVSTEINNNAVENSSTDTASDHNIDEDDDDIFITQNNFNIDQGSEHDIDQSADLFLSEGSMIEASFDINIEDFSLSPSRPKRKCTEKKLRQSSIYEYYN